MLNGQNVDQDFFRMTLGLVLVVVFIGYSWPVLFEDSDFVTTVLAFGRKLGCYGLKSMF